LLHFGIGSTVSSHAFLKIIGGIAAADHVGGKEFPFKAATLEEGYTVKQILKLVQTGLKKGLLHTHIGG
jgi:hypothetical protein